MTEKYQSVNGQWPAGTNDGRDLIPTAQEAMTACRRLYRFAMKKKMPWRMKLTSGRRRTWVRRGVLLVNPDEGARYKLLPGRGWSVKKGERVSGGGWHEIVHSMSHLCANRLYGHQKTFKGHGHQHAFLEREMIAYVVKSGWLEGKLKRPEKPKVEVDVKSERAARIAARLAKWQAKKKRAETAIRKLTRQARYYDRQLAA